MPGTTNRYTKPLTREEAAWLRACAERDQKYAEWQAAAEEASRLGRLAFGETK